MRVSVAGITLMGGRLFIARRKAGGALGGKWEFPGGKAEAGESDGEALKREYREELGLAVRPGPLLGEASFEHGGEAFSLRGYEVFLDPDAPIVLTEHEETRWAAPEEIEALDFAPSDKSLLQAIRSRLGF